MDIADTLKEQTVLQLVWVVLISLCCLGSPDPIRAEETVQLRPYHRLATLTGFTRAKQTMKISSEVSGNCLALHGQHGETIPLSGRLALIDTTFITLDLEANRLAQKKVLRQLASEKKILKRYTTLHDRKSVPEAILDEVVLNAELHELSLMNLKNEAARLQQRFDRHTITAPPGWQVIERLIEPGEYVQAGQPLAHLGNFKQLLVPLALSFNELQSLERTERISLLLPDLNRRVSAWLYRTSPTFDATTKKIAVDLLLESQQDHLSLRLRGGMRVQLQLRLNEQTNTFVLPLSAVVSRYDAHWLVTAQQQRIKVVFLGRSEDGTLAIISGQGLAVNDTFLVNPSQVLQP